MPEPLRLARGSRPRVRLVAAMGFDGRLVDRADFQGETGRAACRQLWTRLAAVKSAVWLLDSTENPAALEIPAGATTIRLPAGRAVDIASFLRVLRAKHGVAEVICPGGPGLFRTLLEGDLTDRLHLVIRPLTAGLGAGPTLAGLPDASFFPASILWRLQRMEPAGDHCLLEYVRDKNPKKE